MIILIKSLWNQFLFCSASKEEYERRESRSPFPCLKIHNTMTSSINNPEIWLQYVQFQCQQLKHDDRRSFINCVRLFRFFKEHFFTQPKDNWKPEMWDHLQKTDTSAARCLLATWAMTFLVVWVILTHTYISASTFRLRRFALCS